MAFGLMANRLGILTWPLEINVCILTQLIIALDVIVKFLYSQAKGFLVARQIGGPEKSRRCARRSKLKWFQK
jgi:hypothetical protein